MKFIYRFHAKVERLELLVKLRLHSIMEWKNSLSQTRGTSTNWAPLFRVELTFKGHEDAMIFCVSIFIFCLELTVREQLDENDFRHYYGIFLKYHSETTWSTTQLCSKFFHNNYKTLWQRHLEQYISVENLRTWNTIWTNFFLSKYL